jgi:alkanesulfonate monooxygenase SsuD/methylene tetrahydromethanopterin reductase-like flavin-dependent oxidoreductase (luciferase family)
MLEQWQRIWAGEELGTAGAIGPQPPDGRPTLMIGGAADVTFERAARYGDGWIMGGGTPDQFRDGAAKMDAAWQAAGREGAPRKLALGYSRSAAPRGRRPTAT